MKKKDSVKVKKGLFRPKGISRSIPVIQKNKLKKSADDKLKDTSSSVTGILANNVKKITPLKLEEDEFSVLPTLKNNVSKEKKVGLKESSPSGSTISENKVNNKIRGKPEETLHSVSAIPDDGIGEMSRVKPKEPSSPSSSSVVSGNEVEKMKAFKPKEPSSSLPETKVEELSAVKSKESSPASSGLREKKIEETIAIKPDETLHSDSNIKKNKSDSMISNDVQPDNSDDSIEDDITEKDEPLVLDRSLSIAETSRSISLEKVKTLRKRYSYDLKILSRLFHSGIIGKEQYNLSRLKAQERLSIIDDILSKEDDLAVIRELKSRVETNVTEAFKNKFKNNSKAGSDSISELKKLYDDGLITQADLNNKEKPKSDEKADMMIHKIDNVFDEYAENINASIESEYGQLHGDRILAPKNQPRSFKDNFSELSNKIKGYFFFSKQKSAPKNK